MPLALLSPPRVRIRLWDATTGPGPAWDARHVPLGVHTPDRSAGHGLTPIGRSPQLTGDQRHASSGWGEAPKTAAQTRWGTVDLLDMLAEADHHVDLVDCFPSIATRESTPAGLLRERLADCTVVSVGHRSSLTGLHTSELELLGDGRWENRSLVP